MYKALALSPLSPLWDQYHHWSHLHQFLPWHHLFHHLAQEVSRIVHLRLDCLKYIYIHSSSCVLNALKVVNIFSVRIKLPGFWKK